MDAWIWAVLLLALGAVLALMEVFFPSAGLIGFLSAAALLTAVVMGFYQQPWVGWSILAVEALGIPVLIVLAFRYWPKTAMGRRFLLAAPKSDEVLPDDSKKERLKKLIGHRGRAKSKLLLSGVVTIDGQTIDATSESMPIDVGQAVQVVRVEGRSVVVRAIVEKKQPKLQNPLQENYDDPFDAPTA
jgi:membrane-bound ClpP family serine protease